MEMINTRINKNNYGRMANDLRTKALVQTSVGARAALESFYYAFNNRSIRVFEDIWSPEPLIQLDNPLGGIQRGYKPILELYRRIFDGPARVWVEFSDIVEYLSENMAVFTGRENGEFIIDDKTIPLNIRTTRVFRYINKNLGWRQIHHHGSIDDALLLKQYQNAVNG